MNQEIQLPKVQKRTYSLSLLGDDELDLLVWCVGVEVVMTGSVDAALTGFGEKYWILWLKADTKTVREWYRGVPSGGKRVV